MRLGRPWRGGGGSTLHCAANARLSCLTLLHDDLDGVSITITAED